MINYPSEIVLLCEIIRCIRIMAKYILIISCMILIIYSLPALWRKFYTVEYMKTSDIREITDNLHHLMDLYFLPKPLSVVYDDTPRAEFITGVIVGPSGYVRATFSAARFGLREHELGVSVLEQPYPAPIDPRPYLKSIMSYPVYRSWVGELEFLLEGAGCPEGYWRLLRPHVNVIKDWYQEEDNAKKIKSFVTGKYANTKQGWRFREFLEMFIESDNLNEVEACCKGFYKHANWCTSWTPLIKGGIYGAWRSQYKLEL